MGEFGVGNIDTDDDYGNWLKMIRFLEVSRVLNCHETLTLNSLE